MKTELARRFLLLVGAAAVAVVAVACGGGGAQPDAARADATPATGTVSLSWKLTDGSQSIACSDIGASQVTLKLVPQNGIIGVAQPFTCSDGKGTTDSLAAGTYDVTIELVSTAGDLTKPIAKSNVKVTDGGNTDLGQVAFDVPRQGGLSFSLSAGGGPNCTGAGANIDQFSFELVKNASCVPTTFSIAAGKTQPAASYTADCAGATTGCIETDQTVSVTGIASGTYTLNITADVTGSSACWQGAALVVVPGGNLVNDRGELDLQPACNADAGVPDGAPLDGAPPD